MLTIDRDSVALTPLPGVMLGFRADGRLIFMSEDARDFLGLGSDLSSPPTDFVHPEDWPVLSGLIASITRSSASRLGLTLRLRDGASTLYRSFEGSLCSAGGGILGADVIFSGHDITHHIDLTNQYRAVLERMSQPILVHRELRPIYCNPAMVALVDATQPEEILALPNILHLVHPDDMPQALAIAEGRRRGEDMPAQYQLRLVTRSGQPVWVDSQAARIHWQGHPAILLAVNYIGDRKRAEDARRQSERLFARIFQSSPNILCLLEGRGQRIIDVNEAFLNLFACGRSDIIGRSFDEIGIWGTDGQFEAVISTILTEGHCPERELQAVFRSGERRDFMVTGELLSLDGENILMISGRDISESKRQRQEIIAAKEAAELANRAKSEFLANMSHELRTPLNAILGFSDIIANELHGPIGDRRYCEYARDIHESGNHLLSIINDILDLSKIEAGRLEINETLVDFLDVLHSCCRLISPRAKAAEVEVINACPNDLPLFLADERLIKQILLNLLSNAVKFTPEGGIVTVGAECGAEGFAFWVADTGIGMDEKGIELALTSFGQVDSSLSRKQVGSGLGLPLAKAFAERQGGRLEIESALQKGTRVTVVFPPDKVRAA